MTVEPDGALLSAPPLVSVVIATNRVSPFFAEALDSLAAQDYPRWECIVVDDGSDAPDEIERVVHAYLPQARVLHQANAGSAAARNTGVTHAVGSVVAFLDDDDRWPTQMLSAYVDGFRRCPEAVVCYAGIRSIDAEGDAVFETPFGQVADVRSIMRGEVMVLNGNMAVRRDAFEAAGRFDPKRRCSQDLDLVLRLAKLGEFVHAAVCLDYRRHNSNVTKDSRLVAAEVREIILDQLRRARQAGATEDARALRVHLVRNARYVAWSALRSARQNLHEGHALKAVGDLCWASARVLSTPGGLRAMVRRPKEAQFVEAKVCGASAPS